MRTLVNKITDHSGDDIEVHRLSSSRTVVLVSESGYTAAFGLDQTAAVSLTRSQVLNLIVSLGHAIGLKGE